MAKKYDEPGKLPEEERNSMPDPEELVDFTAPLLAADGSDTPIVVGVNGELIRIRRGEPVKIKRKFLWALENAQKQEIAAIRAMREAEASSRKALADM